MGGGTSCVEIILVSLYSRSTDTVLIQEPGGSSTGIYVLGTNINTGTCTILPEILF